MGNKEMDIASNGDKEETYSIVCFSGKLLPSQYMPLIYSKWMRSLRYGNEYFKLINSDDYYENYRKYIYDLIHRPNTAVRLAVLSDYTDVVLGWSLIESDCLHYVHVQSDQRNKGIGKLLVPTKINSLSHLTNTGVKIWNSKLPNAKFNPFFKEKI